MSLLSPVAKLFLMERLLTVEIFQNSHLLLDKSSSPEVSSVWPANQCCLAPRVPLEAKDSGAGPVGSGAPLGRSISDGGRVTAALSPMLLHPDLACDKG